MFHWGAFGGSCLFPLDFFFGRLLLPRKVCHTKKRCAMNKWYGLARFLTGTKPGTNSVTGGVGLVFPPGFVCWVFFECFDNFNSLFLSSFFGPGFWNIPPFANGATWLGGMRTLAVPKKKVSVSRQRKRRNALCKQRKNKSNIENCFGCGRPKLRYHVCLHCTGYRIGWFENKSCVRRLSRVALIRS